MAADSSARNRSQIASPLLLGLVLLYLVPVWLAPDLPTQDGPVHLHTAIGYAEYDAPETPRLREVYARSVEPNPNWTIQLFVGALTRAMSPGAAEKTLVTLIIAGLCLAFFAAVRELDGGPGFVALFVLPFAYNYPLNMGFYNFSLSLAGYCALLAWWVRLERSPSATSWLGFAVGALLLYFTHIVSLLALCLTLAVLSGAKLLAGARPRVLWPLVLALSPAGFLALWFLASEGGTPSIASGPALWFSRVVLAARLTYFSSFGALDVLAPGAAIVLIFALTALSPGPAPAERWLYRGLGVCAALFALLAIVAPVSSLGGQMVSERLLLYAVLLAALRLALLRWSPRIQRVVGAVLVAAALVSVAAQSWHYARFAQPLREFRDCADQVPRDSLLLTLSFDTSVRPLRHFHERVDPFVHAGARIAAERRAIYMGNFAASNGNHPLVWRAGLYPHREIGCIHCLPPTRLRLANYPLPIESILLWRPPASEASLPLGDIALDVKRDYALRCRSAEGSVWLFRRLNEAERG